MITYTSFDVLEIMNLDGRHTLCEMTKASRNIRDRPRFSRHKCFEKSVFDCRQVPAVEVPIAHR